MTTVGGGLRAVLGSPLPFALQGQKGLCPPLRGLQERRPMRGTSIRWQKIPTQLQEWPQPSNGSSNVTQSKVPSGSAACPMLEASCGFSALLAHWDRALHILVGCILLLVHRGLQGLHAGRELRTEACAGNLRLWELCGHSLGWMGSSPPMASWIKQGALAGGWKMVGAGWQLLGSLQCIHPVQGVHRCLLCNDALWASFGGAFSPPLTSGPSTSGKTNHA